MSLDKYLEELSNGASSFKYSELIQLSGLLPQELALVEVAWNQIPPERRCQLVTELVDMAEDDVTMDFTTIFKMALKDSDEGVREHAVAGLWECEEQALISVLINLHHSDPVERVRAAAVQGLGKFAVLAEGAKLLPKDQERIRQALLETFQKESEAPRVRQRAIEALGPFTDDKVRELIWQAYQGPDPLLHRSALYAMGQNAHVDWLPTIVKEIANSDPAMRFEAAGACGNLGEEAVVPHMLPLLRDDDLEVRLSAIHALGAIGGGAAKKALTSCLNSTEEAVQEAAEKALEVVESNDDTLSFDFRL